MVQVKEPKRRNRPTNLSVYLGSKKQREERLQRVKDLALKHAGTTEDGEPAVSRFMQMLADGELEVVEPNPAA